MTVEDGLLGTAIALQLVILWMVVKIRERPMRQFYTHNEKGRMTPVPTVRNPLYAVVMLLAGKAVAVRK